MWTPLLNGKMLDKNSGALAEQEETFSCWTGNKSANILPPYNKRCYFWGKIVCLVEPDEMSPCWTGGGLPLLQERAQMLIWFCVAGRRILLYRNETSVFARYEDVFARSTGIHLAPSCPFSKLRTNFSPTSCQPRFNFVPVSAIAPQLRTKTCHLNDIEGFH
jgi:hypothetical protein